MEYRRLGRSGLQISPIVLGTMNFGKPTEKEEAYSIVDAAIEAGINLIDCADVYSDGESERILGEAFKRNGKRKNILLTSKVFNRTGPGPNDFGNTKHHILAWVPLAHGVLADRYTDALSIPERSRGTLKF